MNTQTALKPNQVTSARTETPKHPLLLVARFGLKNSILKLFLWILASLQGKPAISDSRYCLGRGGDGVWGLAGGSGGSGLGQGLLCAHSIPRGACGELESSQLQGKEQFPWELQFPAPHLSVPWLMQSPPSPTLEG